MDLKALPLTGRHLIEASAGTGKTYTIAHLFTRLIIEKGHDVNQILVVTFTEKATKELKDRIRTNLNQMLSLLESYHPCPPSATDLLQQQSEPNDLLNLLEAALLKKTTGEIKRALKKAVIRFDDASIFTIHGFLNRLLNDHAFESAVPFDTELVADMSGLLKETVDDFFRIHGSDVHPIQRAILVKNGLNPEGFLKLAHTLLSMPLIQIVPPEVEDPSCDLLKGFSAMNDLYQKEREAIKTLLHTSKALKRDEKTFRKDRVDRYINDLDALFSGLYTPDAISSIQMLSTEKMSISLKKNQPAPEHAFFKLCDSFVRNERIHIVRMKHWFARYLRETLPVRKKSDNILSFDDLLTRVFDIVKKDSGAYLIQSVRERYPAILIDEFQDTDTLQYHIFDRVFNGETTAFFMIGDPKQSIYGFRGADIFSYIDAVRHTQDENRHTLDFNWRSESRLVEAVCHLFSHLENPFALGDKIGFTSVRTKESSKGNKAPLLIKGSPSSGLMISLIREEGGEGKKRSLLSKERASAWAERIVSHEIAELLRLSKEGRAFLGQKRIAPSDIAILVTRNADATTLKESLGRAGIPSVVTKAGSVFHTEDALAIERFLLAVCSPNHLKRVNAALSLDMIGLSAATLQAFMEEDDAGEAYESHLKRFHHYHDLWRERGFFRMFRQFLSDYHVRETLLSLPDGERRLSNLLQIAELLHATSFQNHLGINGLLFLLAEKRESEEENADQELRLEHDQEAVQILTIFKSKGLEFPIVFCPFMWQQGALVNSNSQSQVIYHDNQEVYLDVYPEQTGGKSIEKATTERLSELLRLLYVGVTRALNRCYLLTGTIGRFSLSSLDYIFSDGQKEGEEWLNRVIETLEKKDSESFARSVMDLGSRASGSIHVTRYDSPPAISEKPFVAVALKEAPIDRRKINGAFRRSLSITSYSALVSGVESLSPGNESDRLKKDETRDTLPETPGIAANDFFTFPRGSVPGTCIHAIFENIDFTLKRQSEAITLIGVTLERYGLLTDGSGQNHDKSVFDMMRRVLSAPLLKEDPQFRLSAIPSQDRINEMAFYYPLNPDTKSILESLYDQLGKDPMSREETFYGRRVSFSPVQGYMNGFIDLVFRYKDKYYIIDWKTNHLGYAYEDYQPDMLKAYMRLSNYDLQYHIYTLALHLYLSRRDRSYRYETGFGGVFYLFVRGVTPLYPESGIFFDKPPFSRIEKMMAMCE